MNSNIWTIDYKDALGGFISAVVFSVLQLLMQMLQNQTVIDLKQISSTAAIAGIGYILTRFAHDDKNQPLGLQA